jgi:hypothetical protein
LTLLVLYDPTIHFAVMVVILSETLDIEPFFLFFQWC